ncbi:MAG: zf-HC2 domain-containing protein [Clostridiales bacterium]|nr:zf-HC2 domain-containing protein [Clostridiales bacterium]
MAECRKYRDMISPYADDELSGNAKDELERHLEMCASCRSLLLIYQNINVSAAGSLVEPPDSFTESVMSKIKALSENSDAGRHAEDKHKRSTRSVIISIVAAAACLALAFIVSPGLFGLMGTRNSASTVPMASAAPDSAAAEFSSLDAVMKAESGEDTGGEAGDVQPATAGAGNATQAPLTSESSAMPSTAPGAAPQIAVTWRNTSDELRTYYAIFTIEGRLPDGMDENSRTDNSDGTFNIEISVETANRLLKDGFSYEMGAQESTIALIKYTPGP